MKLSLLKLKRIKGAFCQIIVGLAILFFQLTVLGRSQFILAQSTSSNGEEISAERVWLPILGYDSDTGFAFGTIGRTFSYSEGYNPYYRSVSARAMATTKGFYTVDLEFDQLATFGTRMRSTLTLYAERFSNEPYFGNGNTTQFDPVLWEEGYYHYERREYGLFYEGFYPLTEQSAAVSAGYLGVFDIRVDESKSNSTGTLFDRQGLGQNSTFALLPGVGFRLDSRDHEILPTRGFFTKGRIQSTIPTSTLGSISLWELHIRGFIPLFTLPFFEQVILAQQLQIYHSTGDVPFWLKPRLGSRDGLRGAYMNRYQGASSWLYMAELRSWFFEWAKADLRFGGQFFLDIGRVFEGHSSNVVELDGVQNLRVAESPYVYRQLHTSYGFGGVLGIGADGFFLRMDVGFSKESDRIYLGAGYAF